jgi:hypothetical protein
MKMRKEERKDYAEIFQKYRQTVRRAKGLADIPEPRDYAFISAFYFKQNPVGNKRFLDTWSFAEEFSRKIGFPITRIEGAYKKTKGSEHYVSLLRPYKEKFMTYFRQIADNGVFWGMGFGGDNRKDLNFYIGIGTPTEGGRQTSWTCTATSEWREKYSYLPPTPSDLGVHCRLDRIIMAGLSKTALEIARLSVSLADIRYGMVHFMEHSKTPTLSLEGTSHDRLEQKENIDAALWYHHKNEHDTLIRNIYLGNLWTRKHVGGNFDNSPVMAEVRKIVPPENIVQLDDDRIFFMLPYDTGISDRIDPHFEEIRNTLKENLSKHKVLMEHVYAKETKELKGTGDWGRIVMPKNAQQGL